MKKTKNEVFVLRKGKLELRLDQAELRSVVLILRDFQHEDRRRIMEELYQLKEPISVSALYTSLRLEQSVVSHHLSNMRASGIITALRMGKSVFYSLNEVRLNQIVNFVHDLAGLEQHPRSENRVPFPDEPALDVAISLMRALSHPIRIRLLDQIDKYKLIAVNKLYGTLKLEQSTTSQHLRVMREAQLVDCRREGKNIIYWVAYEHIHGILKLVETLEAK
jgi:ArsR family transcriptional regulator